MGMEALLAEPQSPPMPETHVSALGRQPAPGHLLPYALPSQSEEGSTQALRQVVRKDHCRERRWGTPRRKEETTGSHSGAGDNRRGAKRK